MASRVYAQRYPHPVGVYKNGWGKWFVQVTFRGQQHYLGTVDEAHQGAALAAAFRRSMTPEVAAVPQPNVTRVEVAAEPAARFWR